MNNYWRDSLSEVRVVGLNRVPQARQHSENCQPNHRDAPLATNTKVRPHGTYGKYCTERCRCAECRAANRDRNRRWARNKAMVAHGMADPLWVDAEPVRRHVQALMAAGMGVPRIQQTSGVTKGVLIRLVYGRPGRGEAPSRKIRPANAARLLAIRAPLPADGAAIDATGTRRRLQALVAIGWSGAELMRRIGAVGTDFPKLLGRDRVLARTARAVHALYDQLWDTTPPTSTRWERATRSRALAFAAARGWAPPQAWDDDTIDDPTAAPRGIRRNSTRSCPAPLRTAAAHGRR